MDREKVIKGLERCSSIDMCYMEICCYHPKYLECPYHEESECVKHLINDALELLKEQRQIVLCENCKHWEQYSDLPNIGNCPVLDQSRRSDWFCADGERKSE